MKLVRTITVGAARDCNVVLTQDPYVSDRHCTISRDANGDMWIADLGSKNGTWIYTPRGRVRLDAGEIFPFIPGYTLRVGRTSIPWTVGEARRGR